MAERASLPAAAFTERANNLGFDQKMLRLRYGKFLGEEAEEEATAEESEEESEEESS